MDDTGMAGVLLVDDHPAVRQGLALLLSQAGYRVCAEAGSAAEVHAFLDRERARVAILDLHLGQEAGFELIGTLHSAGIPVLAYSMFEDVASVREAFACGAQGYVCKREVADELLSAVHCILMGKQHVSPVAVAALTAFPSAAPSVSGQELSERERQIIELLGQGFGNHEIATRLSLSVRTIESYCARAIDKLGLGGMKELRRYAALTFRRQPGLAE